jgi:hypothetical protein
VTEETPPPGWATALASGLERASTRLTKLTDDLAALAVVVERLSRPEEANAEGAGSPSALLGLTHDAVHDLLEWLEQVYLRYSGARLSACWAWHADVVEELLVLRTTHLAVYSSNDPLRISDWHDRYRPGVVRRVNATLKNCSITTHDNDLNPELPLKNSLTALNHARSNDLPTPAPTPTQLHEARQYETRQTATRR